jgi:hypothetical protein
VQRRGVCQMSAHIGAHDIVELETSALQAEPNERQVIELLDDSLSFAKIAVPQRGNCAERHVGVLGKDRKLVIMISFARVELVEAQIDRPRERKVARGCITLIEGDDALVVQLTVQVFQRARYTIAPCDAPP